MNRTGGMVRSIYLDMSVLRLVVRNTEMIECARERAKDADIVICDGRDCGCDRL